MEDETKTARIDQKSTFFLVFFSKNSGYKGIKNTNFSKGVT